MPRRSLLSGGAALAATAVLVAPQLKQSFTGAESPASDVVVRWDSRTGKWAPRPAKAEFGVVFLSTNDPAATPPTDTNIQAGDVWRRHPDAVAA
jgi:hypothetical protein